MATHSRPLVNLDAPLAAVDPSTAPGTSAAEAMADRAAQPTRPLSTIALPVGWWFAFAITLANFVNGLLWNPTQALLLPVQVAAFAPTTKVVALGVVTSLGVAVSLIATPLAGAWSDRTVGWWGRFGRRRPWIAIGSLASLVALLLMGYAPSLMWLAVGWCLLQVFGSGAYAALYAIVPDQVPDRQRGWISGLVNLAAALSILIGAVVFADVLTDIHAAYLALAGALIVGTLPLLLGRTGRRDRPIERRDLPPWTWTSFLAGFVRPFAERDFRWAFASRFCLYLAVYAPIDYLFYWLSDDLHIARRVPGQTVDQAVAMVLLLSTATLMLASVLAGVASDRSGARRKPFVVAAGILLAGVLVAMGFTQDWTLILVEAALLGVGLGIYFAVDLALVTQVLRDRHAFGRDLGILYCSTALPQAGAYIIAAVIVGTTGSYTLLFGLASLGALLGGFLVWPIKSVR